MIFVSINDRKSLNRVIKLCRDYNVQVVFNVSEDKYKQMIKSKVIVTDLDLVNIKFAMSKGKRIIIILESGKKLSKSERLLLKNKKIYICKSEEQAVEIAKYLLHSSIMVKRIIISLLVLFMFVLLSITIGNVVKNNYIYNEKEIEAEIDYKEENIVFIGDSITDFYDFEKYYKDLPIINSGISGYRTDDVYNTLEEKLYIYNPTKVFLMVGTNDFIDGKSNEYIIDKIIEIIEEIQDNRPLANIYLQSIYPVNNTDDEKISKSVVGGRDNVRINQINKELKEFCKDEKNCTYIDVHGELQDDDGNLRLEYTTEGLHISDEGYEVVTEKLMPYIEKVEK